ncbi:MAG: transcription termination factor Rho [Lachnospiraceae bacterium]|nr:transcription termination factor Rho [Lachnospiraceae bacterium]
MREKYESLQLVQLKELAKARGLKGVSIMKKAALIELMLAEDEKEKAKAEGAKPAPAKEEAPKSAVPAKEEAPKAAAPAREEGARPAQNRTVVKVNQEFQRKPESRISFVRNESQSASRVEGGSNRYEASGNGNYTRNNNYGSNSGNYNNYKKNDNRTDNVVRENKTDMRTDNSETAEDRQQRPAYRPQEAYDESQYPKELDSGVEASGILEVMPDGYGFIRCENYMPGENDVYVAPSQIRRFGLKTGDILKGNKRIKTQQEKFSALLFVRSINGYTVEEASRRMNFEDMTPIFPNERINLETPGCSVAMRVMDLVSPVGKGQRGMIVSPPKAGKTTLLKEVAKSILRTNPHMHMLILLIDERPEEVTDIREAIQGENVEVIYSTFDELPEHHKRVSEMVIERAKRLVEHKKDVVILIDSITRLTRAYNQVVPPSGRTLSGGLDPSALHMPKRFFGAARNMREGGSLTILATALVDTGSKMDDVVYEEFKGTGNMEMILDRKLSEKRIFPAIDLQKSGTRREDLLLDADELEAINIMRKALNGLKPDEATDKILDMFSRTRNNREFVSLVKKNRFL